MANLLGHVTISKSVFAGNISHYAGGGMLLRYGETSIVNSTFSGNTAKSGGGLYARGGEDITVYEASPSTPLVKLWIRHSTFAYNVATGGSIRHGSGLDIAGRATIENSLIVKNTGVDCYIYAYRTTANMEDNIDSDGSCNGGLDSTQENPGIDPSLADNGGGTLTHAILPGSPLIDILPDCAGLVDDQRGFARPIGTGCDPGAYEREELGEPPRLPPPPPPPDDECTFTASMNLFCRSGPGSSVYPDIDEFTAGESAPVVGVSEDGNFYYVLGVNTGEACTVPVNPRYGETEGDCQSLTVLTAPPPPAQEPVLPQDPPPQPQFQGCLWSGNLSTAPTCVVPCPNDANSGAGCNP